MIITKLLTLSIEGNSKESIYVQHERKVWIDSFKSLGIILVVWGHLPISPYAYNFIYSFHMYAFFFISGILNKYKSGKTYSSIITKNIKQLYLPYLFFTLVWITFSSFISSLALIFSGRADFNLYEVAIYCIKILATLIYGTDSYFQIHMGPAWFLITLITVKIIYEIMQKVTHNNKVWLGIFSSGLFILGYVFNNKNFLPLSLIPAMTALPFYYLGDLTIDYINNRIKKYTISRKVIGSIILFSICFICSLLVEAPLILMTNKLPKDVIIVLVGSISGIFALVLLSMILADIDILGKKVFLFLGLNSLVIMGIHSPIREIIFYMFKVSKLDNTPLALKSTINFISTILICIPICYIFEKYFPKLIGKSKTNY